MVFTGDGRNFASNFWNLFGTIFSQILGIICISGGYQDLLPGFYQMFTLIDLGMFELFTGKPTRNLLGTKAYQTIQKHLRHFCRLPYCKRPRKSLQARILEIRMLGHLGGCRDKPRIATCDLSYVSLCRALSNAI